MSITGTPSDTPGGAISTHGNTGTVTGGNIAVQSTPGYIFDNLADDSQGLPVVDILGLEYQAMVMAFWRRLRSRRGNYSPGPSWAMPVRLGGSRPAS